MIDINNMGERIDILDIASLIAYSLGRKQPVSRKTVYLWQKKGYIPDKIKTPTGAAVWDKNQCMEMLGLNK